MTAESRLRPSSIRREIYPQHRPTMAAPRTTLYRNTNRVSPAPNGGSTIFPRPPCPSLQSRNLTPHLTWFISRAKLRSPRSCAGKRECPQLRQIPVFSGQVSPRSQRVTISPPSFVSRNPLAAPARSGVDQVSPSRLSGVARSPLHRTPPRLNLDRGFPSHSWLHLRRHLEEPPGCPRYPAYLRRSQR